MAITSAAMITSSSKFLRFGVQCSDNSNPRRGFGSNTNIKVSIPCFSFHFTHFGHTHKLIICSLLSFLLLSSLPFWTKESEQQQLEGGKGYGVTTKVRFPTPSNYLLIYFQFLSMPYLLSLIIAAVATSVFFAENQLLNNPVPHYLLVRESLLPSYVLSPFPSVYPLNCYANCCVRVIIEVAGLIIVI